jgi:hypothetical protein
VSLNPPDGGDSHLLEEILDQKQMLPHTCNTNQIRII